MLNQRSVLLIKVSAKLKVKCFLIRYFLYTRTVFEIKDTVLSDNQIKEINQIDSRSKIKDRIEKIKELSGTLSFRQTESTIFGNNLSLIDSSLPQILAEIVYKFFTSGHSKTLDLVSEISRLKTHLNSTLKLITLFTLIKLNVS